MRGAMGPEEYASQGPEETEGAGPRVVHIIPSALGRGAELFARALVDELGGPDNGHRLLCLFEGDHDVAVDDTLGLPGGSGAGKGINPRAVGRLLRYLNRTDPDVVVAHGGIPYKHAALAARSPLVLCAIGPLPAKARAGARHLLWRAIIRRARVVAAVCQDVAVGYRDSLGVGDDRLVVIPNARDASRFRPGPQRHLATGSGDAVSLLFVGHLTAGKRPDVFIELVRALRESGLAVEGRIVGDGPMRDALAGPADDCGVDILGYRADVVAELQQADLLVLPSLSEGMPGVLIEAGLCGLPSVATRVGGASSVIADQESGVLVAADDFAGLVRSTAELVRHPDRRLAMGAVARSRCEQNFAIQGVAARWDELLRGVSATAPGRHPLPESHDPVTAFTAGD